MKSTPADALVLTSTVHVNAPYTVLQDAGERERQYLESIRYFIRESPMTNIVVCDNSGFRYPDSLYAEANKMHKQIELLSFVGDRDRVMRYGKGYGEGEIMDFVLRNSLLVARSEGFLKVTGRLKVANLLQILRRSDLLRGNYFMPVSLLRPRWLVPRAARPCVDTRVYYVTRDFFSRFLLTVYKDVREREGFLLEHAYYKAIAASSVPVRCFYPAPEIVGMSGSNGWLFRERSAPRKLLIKIVAFLGYVKPV